MYISAIKRDGQKYRKTIPALDLITTSTHRNTLNIHRNSPKLRGNTSYIHRHTPNIHRTSINISHHQNTDNNPLWSSTNNSRNAASVIGNNHPQELSMEGNSASRNVVTTKSSQGKDCLAGAYAEGDTKRPLQKPNGSGKSRPNSLKRAAEIKFQELRFISAKFQELRNKSNNSKGYQNTAEGVLSACPAIRIKPILLTANPLLEEKGHKSHLIISSSGKQKKILISKVATKSPGQAKRPGPSRGEIALPGRVRSPTKSPVSAVSSKPPPADQPDKPTKTHSKRSPGSGKWHGKSKSQPAPNEDTMSLSSAPLKTYSDVQRGGAESSPDHSAISKQERSKSAPNKKKSSRKKNKPEKVSDLLIQSMITAEFRNSVKDAGTKKSSSKKRKSKQTRSQASAGADSGTRKALKNNPPLESEDTFETASSSLGCLIPDTSSSEATTTCQAEKINLKDKTTLNEESIVQRFRSQLRRMMAKSSSLPNPDGTQERNPSKQKAALDLRPKTYEAQGLPPLTRSPSSENHFPLVVKALATLEKDKMVETTAEKKRARSSKIVREGKKNKNCSRPATQESADQTNSQG